MTVDGEPPNVSSQERPPREHGANHALAGLLALAAAGLAVFGVAYLLTRHMPDPLLQVEPGLESLGASLEKVTLTVWTPLPTADQVDALASRAVQNLGLLPDPASPAALAPGAGSERRAFRLPDEGGTVTLTLHRVSPAALSVVMELPAPASRWWEWRSRLVRAIGDDDAEAVRAYTVLQFSGEGRWLWSSRRSVAASVLHSLDARLVEGADDDSLYSLTAYTPRLRQRLLVAGRPVNTAVALHWDATRGRTVLWLGSPVINIEY